MQLFETLFLSLHISFIDDRYKIVSNKEYWSNLIRVTSRVPQGSYLAPIPIFINDIIFENQTKCMFSDDIKIFLKVNCQEDADLFYKLISL